MDKFFVNEISKYRSHLMGTAALLVIFGHSAGNGVVMPGWMESLYGLASVGVDIFLLVSGLGLWYSLQKSGTSVGRGNYLAQKEMRKNIDSISIDYRGVQYSCNYKRQ